MVLNLLPYLQIKFRILPPVSFKKHSNHPQRAKGCSITRKSLSEAPPNIKVRQFRLGVDHSTDLTWDSSRPEKPSNFPMEDGTFTKTSKKPFGNSEEQVPKFNLSNTQTLMTLILVRKNGSQQCPSLQLSQCSLITLSLVVTWSREFTSKLWRMPFLEPKEHI